MTFDVNDIRATAEKIAPYIERTPVITWQGSAIDALCGDQADVSVKLELWQRSGTFKARGALSNMLRLSDDQRARGVTAMSAGNHAIAVAYAAAELGIDARLVMQASANPARIALAKSFGAEVLIAADGRTGFAMAEAIAADEGRTFIHPFDGEATALGTATLGLEYHEQAGPLDVLIVGIGGGGLAGGLSHATKLMNPNCKIIGVEPEGAATMNLSFAAGEAQSIELPATIADSLAPPMTLPYPYSLCRRNVGKLLCVSDDEIRAAMRLIWDELGFAVEPAAATPIAALAALKADIWNKKVGLLFCGSNIDLETYNAILNS